MPITVDQFWQQYAFQPYELIRGEVSKSDPLGFRYAIVGMRVEANLLQFVEEHSLGEVFGANNGYRLNKYTLRAPRVSYITTSKFRHITHPYDYLPFAPDIAVEILDSNTTEDQTKIMSAQYVRAGTRYVWVFQPDLLQMMIYSRFESPRRLTIYDTLTAPIWHPDFAVPLSDLLPKPRGMNLD